MQSKQICRLSRKRHEQANFWQKIGLRNMRLGYTHLPVGYSGLLFEALAPYFTPPQKTTLRLHVVPCTTEKLFSI